MTDLHPHVVASVPGTTVQAPSSRRAWTITAMLVIAMALSNADKVALGLASQPLMQELGLTAAQFGLLGSSFYLLFGVSSIVVGFISNRVKTKWILLVLVLAWSLTQIPMIAFTAFPALLAGRVALGAAEGPAQATTAHAVQKWFPEHKRSLPTSLVWVGSALGIGIGAPVLAWIISNLGWRSAFLTLIFIGVLWAVLWLKIGDDGPYGSPRDTRKLTAMNLAPEQKQAQQRVKVRHVMTSITTLAMIPAAFAATYAVAILMTWVPNYLETIQGYSTVAAGSAIAIPRILTVALEIAIPVAAGWAIHRGVSSRVARGFTAAGILVVSGLCVFAFPGAPAGSALQFVLIAAGFGLPSVVYVLQVLIIADITPVRIRGAVLGISVAISTTAGMIAPALMGQLVGTADQIEQGYRVGFTIVAVLLVFGGVVMTLINPAKDATKLGMDCSIAATAQQPPAH